MAAVQGTTARAARDSRPVLVAALVAAAAGIAIIAILIATAPRLAQPGGQDTTGGVAVGARYVTYQQTISKLVAAVRQHDSRSVALFSAELESTLTPATVQALYAERERLLASLGVAKSRHDSRMVAAINQQLHALCPPMATQAAPSFCR